MESGGLQKPLYSAERGKRKRAGYDGKGIERIFPPPVVHRAYYKGIQRRFPPNVLKTLFRLSRVLLDLYK